MKKSKSTQSPKSASRPAPTPTQRRLAWAGIVATASAFCLIVYYGLKFTGVGQANSVGIIGGADGPTQVYLSGTTGVNWIEVSLLLIAGAAIIYLIVMTDRKKDQS